MATQINKGLAKKIAKKLRATIDKSGSAHDLAMIYEGGVLVASFGIRRGSQNNLGHDHIPKDLNVPTRFAKDLGNCPRTRDDYLTHLRQIGDL